METVFPARGTLAPSILTPDHSSSCHPRPRRDQVPLLKPFASLFVCVTDARTHHLRSQIVPFCVLLFYLRSALFNERDRKLFFFFFAGNEELYLTDITCLGFGVDWRTNDSKRRVNATFHVNL